MMIYKWKAVYLGQNLEVLGESLFDSYAQLMENSEPEDGPSGTQWVTPSLQRKDAEGTILDAMVGFHETGRLPGTFLHKHNQPVVPEGFHQEVEDYHDD